MQASRLIAALAVVALLAAAMSPASAQFSLAPADEQGAVQDRLTSQQMQPPPELRNSLAPPGATPQGGQPPAWLVIPRIDIQEEATDNVRQSTAQRTADLVTTVSPGIFVSGETPALRTSIDYSPSFQRNIVATDQDAIYQRGFATATATLLPDRLFFDARGSAFEGSLAGADSAFSPESLPRADRTQVLAASAGPVVKIPVFDQGTAELRYTLGDTQFLENTSTVSNGTSTPVNSISSAIQQELRASIDSGQSFGRVENRLILDASRVEIADSTASSEGAYVTDETKYKLSSNFTLIGSLGYQVYDFPEAAALDFSGLTAAGGFEYTPKPDSYVRLTYGHRDGANSFQGDARYAVTPLTTAFASYVESITTPQQSILGNLSGAAETSNGTIVNSQTGLPTSLYNSEIALQNDILRVGTLTGGVTADLSPNVFTITFMQQAIQSLTGATPSDGSVGGTASWTRLVSPTTNFSLVGAYFHHNVNNENSVDARALLTHSFTDTLFGNIRYEFAKLDSDEAGRSFYQNSMTVSMRKLF